MREEIQQILVAQAKAIRNIPVTDHFGKAVEPIYRRFTKKEEKWSPAVWGRRVR